MPATTYMDVHPRRDHSLRIPRPDLSVSLGTPNACTGCHLQDTKIPAAARPRSPSPNRSAEYADWLRSAEHGDATVKAELGRLDAWADGQIKKWFGNSRKTPAHFATALAAARNQEPDAAKKLLECLADTNQPAVARATAALELSEFASLPAALPADEEGKSGQSSQVGKPPQLGQEVRTALHQALLDRDPQVRAAAAMSLPTSGRENLAALRPLLRDAIRLVRVRAAQALAPVAATELTSAEIQLVRTILEDWTSGLKMENDRPESHLAWGAHLEGLASSQLAQRQEAMHQRQEAGSLTLDSFDKGELGQQLQMAWDYLEEARSEYALAIRLAPGQAAPHGQMAALVLRMVELAREDVDRYRRLNRPAELRAAEEKADQLEQQFARLKSEELGRLERDALVSPDDPMLLLQLGLARQHAGWDKEAESAMRTAHHLSPRSPTYAFYLAILLKDTGRLAESLTLVEQMLTVRPARGEFEQLKVEIQEALHRSGR